MSIEIAWIWATGYFRVFGLVMLILLPLAFIRRWIT